MLSTLKSVEYDKRKELKSIQDKVKEEQDLYRERLANVVHEPDINEPHVTVSVRHLTIGVQTRRFPIPCLISSIYDWVGSLSPNPTHFTLSSCDMASLDPSLPVTLVDRALLNMAVAESDEMAIFPALNKDCSSIKQIPDNHDLNNPEVIEDIWEVPPPFLLEGDVM